MAACSSRRRFLETTIGAGLGGLAGVPLLPQLQPVAAARCPFASGSCGVYVRHRADRADDRGHTTRTADGDRRGQDSRRIIVPRDSGRPAVGRRSQCATSAACGFQVPCRVGGQLRPPGQYLVSGRRSLAADPLGIRLLQSPAHPNDVQEGDWTMSPVDEQRLPTGSGAKTQFQQAMDRWDVEAADRAVAGWSRTAGTSEMFEAMFRFGARDLRDIGHKAIFVANSYRTLQCIGWRYAEPVLRSLTYALLNHTGEPNPNESDLAPDRPWRDNMK